MSKKYVVWEFEDGYREKEEEFESSVPREKINFFKLFWYVLTDRHFAWALEETIKYALRHARCYRGVGASDVALFRSQEKYIKIWKKEP